MRNLARMGRLSEALATYTKLQTLLQEELGLPPSADTRALADMLQGELDQRRRAWIKQRTAVEVL